MNNEYVRCAPIQFALGMEFQSKIPFSNRNGCTILEILHIIFNYYSGIYQLPLLFHIRMKIFHFEILYSHQIVSVQCTLCTNVSIHEQSAAINKFHLHILIKHLTKYFSRKFNIVNLHINDLLSFVILLN